jgi:RNA polymerase sigma factor FliA
MGSLVVVRGSTGDQPATQARRSAKRSRDDAESLWRDYRRTGDPGLRDRLVLTFAPLVKYLVYRKIREAPAHLEVDDFISSGIEAIIVSLDRYDPEKGATLEQFLWTRIHGAIIDEMRRQDWAPRSLRRFERQLERTRSHFTAQHGRAPTRQELADALSMPLDELRERQQELQTTQIGSLNSLVVDHGSGEGQVEAIDTVEDADQRDDPERRAAAGQGKDAFRQAFARLPQRDREIAVLLYVKQLTLREVGEILGVSESRVSQLHTAMRKRLRHELAAHAGLLSDVA